MIKGHFSLLLLLSLAVMLVMAGESMLTAALVDIEHEFSVPGIYESWVLPVVLLVGAVAAPFVGTAGDRFGHRRLLLLCLSIYLLGLVLGYLSTDIWTLLISRGLQGAGIAAFPLAYGIIRDRMEGSDADMSIGVISAMYGAGTFLGVITGSFITGYFSWRMTYLVLIPAAFILILLVYLFIHDTKEVYHRGRLDWWGFFMLLIFLFLVLEFFSLPGDEKTGLFAGGTGLLCIISFLLFVYIEKNAITPLADFRLLRHRQVIVFMAIGFLTMLAYFILLQMMPYVIRLPTGLSLSAEVVGLILIPGTLCDMIAGILTGKMVVQVGCRIPCIIGSFLLAGVGVLLLSVPLSVPVLVIGWMLFAFGMSVIATADLIGIIYFVGSDRTSEATGVIQSMQTIGGMAGPIVTGILLESSQARVTIGGEEWTVPTAGAYDLVFISIVILGFVLLVVSWVFMGEKKNRVNVYET